jgi:hypothetical protein
MRAITAVGLCAMVLGGGGCFSFKSAVATAELGQQLNDHSHALENVPRYCALVQSAGGQMDSCGGLDSALAKFQAARLLLVKYSTALRRLANDERSIHDDVELVIGQVNQFVPTPLEVGQGDAVARAVDLIFKLATSGWRGRKLRSVITEANAPLTTLVTDIRRDLRLERAKLDVLRGLVDESANAVADLKGGRAFLVQMAGYWIQDEATRLDAFDRALAEFLAAHQQLAGDNGKNLFWKSDDQGCYQDILRSVQGLVDAFAPH